MENGLIRFVPNSELIENEDEERKRLEEDNQNRPEILDLVNHLKKCWENNKREKKKSIEPRLRACKRQREGKYAEDKMAAIREQGGSDIYMMLTDVKAAATEAWIGEFLSSSERPFAATPTTVADLPDEIEGAIKEQVISETHQSILGGINVTREDMRKRMEEIFDETRKEIQKEAKRQAKRQEDEINDDFVEGGWYEALKECIYDIATYPTAFVEGPVVRFDDKLAWEGTDPVVTKQYRREYRRVSPWNVYPAKGAMDANEGPLFIHDTFTRKALKSMIGLEGYSEDAIRAVLSEYREKGYVLDLAKETGHAAEVSRESGTEGEDPQNPDATIDALKFFASIPGRYLMDWGLEDIEDPEDEYEVTGYLIDRWVIKVVLNEHPLKKRNIYTACFREDPESIWGQKALPELMSDVQDVCNACARNLVNNMGIASGPQVVMDLNRIPAGEDVTTLTPWKIHQVEGDKASSLPPIDFYQPNPMVETLLKVFDYFYKLASEVTGVPAYVYGNADVGGAARTASGLSMLMNSASKGLKRVVSNIDTGIIVPSVKSHHEHLMLFSPERVYMGDIEIQARASEYLVMLEQLTVRRIEFLNATANEYDMNIMGLEGRAKVLRRVAEGMKIGDAVPNEEQFRQDRTQEQIMAVLQAISQQFDVPIETLVQAIQAPNPTQTTPDGQLMGGREAGLFNQGETPNVAPQNQ